MNVKLMSNIIEASCEVSLLVQLKHKEAKQMKETLQAIITRLEAGELATLKAAKEELITLDLFSTARTKAAFIEEVAAIIAGLPSEDEAVTELDALESEIKQTITAAGKATFHLGELLIKAKEVHDTTQDFLVWVNEKFGIKKAWCFKLMKVAQTFQEEVWHGVSANVLYVLQSQATDYQLDKARELAEAGNLNSKSLAELLEPPQQPVKQETTIAPATASEQAGKLIEDALTGGEPLAATESKPALPEAKEPQQGDNQQVLLEKISELTEQLATTQRNYEALQLQLLEATKPRIAASSAPMLPQFTSSCLYARLGLAAEDATDKAKILEAFKSLCKAGYGRQHEAYSLLDEARHELIHTMENAA